MYLKKTNFLLFIICSFVWTCMSCSEDDEEKVVIGMPGIDLQYLEPPEHTETNQVTIKFLPNSETSWYEYAIGKETDWENFAKGTLPDINKQIGSEEKSITFTDLKPETSYTIFAKSYNTSDEAGPIASIKVRIKPADFMEAEIQYLSDVSIGFKLSTSETYYKYDYAIGTPEDKEAFENGTLEGIKTKNEYYQYTVNHYDLSPETNYVFYIKGYGREGSISATKEIPFTTLGKEECPGVELIINSIDPIAANYAFSPNSKCTKVAIRAVENNDDPLFLLTAESYAQYRGDMLSLMDNWVKLNPILNNLEVGEEGYLVHGQGILTMSANTLIDVYAALYGENPDTPFCIKKMSFSIPYVPNIPSPKMEIEISDITSFGATYKYLPDDNTYFYLYDTADADYIDKEWAKHGNDPQWLADFFIELYNMGESVKRDSSPVIFTETEGIPGTRYYAMAIACNINGKLGAEIFMKEYYTLQ